MRTWILICSLFWTSAASAGGPPLPPDQWNAQTHLWLSRAGVAEAGWEAESDYDYIAWALFYRWRTLRKQWPNMRYVDVVRGYCAGLEGRATRRQTWVRNLPPMGEDTEPKAWPKKLKWSKYLPLWRAVQKRMLRWGRGEIRDRSRGRVRHWGSPSTQLPDIARAQRAIREGRWVLLDLGDTKNQFYGFAPRSPSS